MTTYDDKILQEYADDLYKQAKWIVVWTAVRYGLALFLVSFAIIVVVLSVQKDISTGSANVGALLIFGLTLAGILAGADAGRRKAFMLKLQAQHILCQRQTEINTRK